MTKKLDTATKTLRAIARKEANLQRKAFAARNTVVAKAVAKAVRKSVTKAVRKANSKPTGFVIYQGPSLLDGMPIVVIATLKSRNGKTGNMIQTWIIRSDVSPLEASRMGLDSSICGNCPHRGIATYAETGVAADRSCYVDIGRSVMAIYKTYIKGRYPTAAGHAAIAAIGKGRKVRLGAYGDMSAAPYYVAESLISDSDGHTAYSHQSGNSESSYNPALYMISADSAESAQTAWNNGARTFRVVSDYSEMVDGKEIACPSIRGVHCIDCGLCDGTSRHPNAKSIAIVVHGAGAKHFTG